MPARVETSVLSVDESKFLAVVNPYPLNANLGHYPDQRALALWLACCAGKDVLRAMFYRPSFPEMVVIEVNREFDSFHELLGQHVWSEFLVKPTKEHRGKSSTVFYSTFNTGRLVRNGWTRVEIEEHWFKGWTENNSEIKYPYPKSSQCNAPSSSEAMSSEPVCDLLPKQSFSMPLPAPGPPVGSAEWLAAARRSNAASTPSSTKNGKTAAPSNTASVTSARSKSTISFSPPSAQSRSPSSAVANNCTKSDTRKRGPLSVSSKAPGGTSHAPSTLGGSNARSSKGAPPAFSGLGRTLTSQSRTSERFDLSEDVERFEPEQINSPPASTPAPSFSSHPAPRQLYDPHSPIEPSRVYEYEEEDQPRHSTMAAMTDLFDDGFFMEVPSVRSGSGGARALGPDDPDYDPWNPPAGTENLWEGYDAPRLEPPTKVQKNGEWTCPQHGSLCSPGICKERGRVERDERMRDEREKREEERVQRETRRARGKFKREKKAIVTGEGKGEWRSRPQHLRRNSSTSSSNNSSNNGSDSSDTSRNQGSGVPSQPDQEDGSIDSCSLNAGGADTQSTEGSASYARGSVARFDDYDYDEGASVEKSHTTNTSSATSRSSRIAPQTASSASCARDLVSILDDDDYDEGVSIVESRITNTSSAIERSNHIAPPTESSASCAQDLVSRLDDDDYDEGASVVMSRTANTSSAIERSSHIAPPTEGSANCARDSVASLDDDNYDEGANVVTARNTNTSSVISRSSRVAPPASVISSQQNKGPISPTKPSSNAQTHVSPTSPGPATRQPAWDARTAASQKPSADRRSVLPSLSGNPTSVSAAPSNTGQRSGAGTATRQSASAARSSVFSSAQTGAGPFVPSASSRTNGLPTYDPITKWLADTAREASPQGNRRRGGRGANAEGRQKVSKGARKRRNKAKTEQAQVQAQVQAAQASVLESALDLANSWGNPNEVW